ncbi:MAG: phenylalanine--tRNA ligase subunit beta [Elusimicrobiota bacterium]|jgi:phenylalanyl-tRNA synthetase beta chain|nr:phenylalanine--tRNA ligase subunit beta [Elusimicrobiota bacterium]
MKLSYNYLKRFVEFKLPPEDIANILSSIGIETRVISCSGAWTNVVTAKVLEKEKHPNADKLSVCKVSDGQKEYTIVCGAKNVAAGQIVALSKIGAVLPGGFEIKKSKIRNIESEGMLCSEKELDIKGESNGILVLNPDTKIGIALENILETDAILEIEIATNRGDCLSYLGVARELSAKLKEKILMPQIKPLQIAQTYSVDVKSPLCSRYIAVEICDAKIAPSPKWLCDVLEKSGIRPINNIVDITNYVMIETGQPLHAFDISKLSSGKIIVRNAKDKEKIKALDGKDYELSTEMLVIADEKTPIAIAGVMGGELSGIDNNTKNLLLESAIFNAACVRKTSKKLNLSSDSSYRFERGLSWDIAELASWRAANLIAEIAGGKIISRKDLKNENYSPLSVELRLERAEKILGYGIAEKEILDILNFLSIETKKEEKNVICKIPSWRNDIKEEIDLIEEIARIKGYDSILTSETNQSVFTPYNSFFPLIVDEFRNKLSCLGFSEALNYSFLEISEVEKFGLKHFYKIANPISKENEILRPSLLPALYRNVKLNLDHDAQRVALFEYGKTFSSDGEKKTFAFIASGHVWDEWWRWEEKKVLTKFDFYFGLGIVKNILPLGFTISQNAKPDNLFHKGKTASVFFRGKPVAQFGILNPLIAKDVENEIFYFEIDIEPLLNYKKTNHFESYSKFPEVKRDISIVADKTLEFVKIEKIIKSVMKNTNVLQGYSVFSVYDDEEKLGEGKISYSFRLFYQNKERTLTDSEVNADMNLLIEKFSKELNVRLRQ